VKYAVIVTYTTGERTGASISASDLTEAWEKLFSLFDKNKVRGVEFAAIVTEERMA
jgi:hypothetical protein